MKNCATHGNYYGNTCPGRHFTFNGCKNCGASETHHPNSICKNYEER